MPWPAAMPRSMTANPKGSSALDYRGPADYENDHQNVAQVA